MGKAKLFSWVLPSNRWKLSKLRDHFSPWKCISWNGQNKDCTWNILRGRFHSTLMIQSPVLDSPWTCQKVLHTNAIFFSYDRMIFSRQWSVMCSMFRFSMNCTLKHIKQDCYWSFFFLQFQMQLFQFVVDISSIHLCGSPAKNSSIPL